MADLTEVYAKSYRSTAYGMEVYDGDIWRGLDYGGAMRAGYKFSDSNWVLCIKFTLPVAVRSLLFSFCNDEACYEVVQHLRWKITSEEDVSLQTATSEIPGDGTFDVNPSPFVRTELNIKKNLRAGTYYLYLWSNDSSVESNAMKIRWRNNDTGYGFYASYEKQSSKTRIKDANGVRPYSDHIKTGGRPVMHVPHILADGVWKPLGG